MANVQPGDGGGSSPAPKTAPSSTIVNKTASVVAGTDTSWHKVVLWFLGAVALIALADPAPQIATALVLLIIMGTILNNWPIYKTYLGLK